MLQTTSSLPRVVAVLMTVAIGVVGVMPYRLTAATPAVASQTPVAAARPAPASKPTPLPAPTATATHNGVIVTNPADMPRPPAPVAPPSPVAPPAPPAPIAPLEPLEPLTGGLRGTFTLGTQQVANAFVLLDDDHSIAVSATSDLREAQSARRGDAPVLWLRRGDARYVVRDRATIEAIRDAYAEVTALGEAQGELGARQGSLGGQQGALGARQAEIALQAATRALADVDVRAQVDANVSAALQREQVGMQAEMQRLATQQTALAREQAALATRQQTASARAEREARALMDAAIRTGLTERL